MARLPSRLASATILTSDTALFFFSPADKVGLGGVDYMVAGTYVANGPRENGTWVPHLKAPQQVDFGCTAQPPSRHGGKHSTFYASKDFYDPVMNRRILWGWVQNNRANTMSLPREVTWHPGLEMLCFAPVAEQDELRMDPIAVVGRTALNAGARVPIGDAPPGNRSEVLLTFARLATGPAARLNISIPASQLVGHPASVMNGVELAIDYAPGRGASEAVVRCDHANMTATFPLLPSDTTIAVRVYTDGATVEAFFGDGRLAATLETGPLAGTIPPTWHHAGNPMLNATITVSANVSATLVQGKAWTVGSIWVSSEDVLATPRKDGRG